MDDVVNETALKSRDFSRAVRLLIILIKYDMNYCCTDLGAKSGWDAVMSKGSLSLL